VGYVPEARTIATMPALIAFLFTNSTETRCRYYCSVGRWAFRGEQSTKRWPMTMRSAIPRD